MTPRPIPCRLPVMHAIYTSSLARPLRDVALAIAWFADDDGANMWPSLETLAGMVAADPRNVRRALRELRQLGVLEAENLSGGRGLTTRYRFDLQVLASLKAGHPRPRLQTPKPGRVRPCFAEQTRTHRVKKEGVQVPKGGHFASETRALAPPDPYDPSGSYIEQERGADAPAALEEDKLKTEEEEEVVVVLCSECDFRGSRFEATSHVRKTRHVLRSSEVQVRYVTHVTEGKKRSG